MKFGGTSVRDLDHIKRAAQKVIREVANGYHVTVVVSAMAGVTNRLVEEASSQGFTERDPEYSAIVSEGELETSRLMAQSINEMGHGAQAWSGPQVPIKCDNNYGQSNILAIPSQNIEDGFKTNQTAVVAGFQGISQEGCITTLGRGGSDTTAVALACALGAERCDIYTDVDGVYTADPRQVKKAQKIDQAAFEEILEMAHMGSKVLHPRCVQLGMKYNIPIQVLSSLGDGIGSDLEGTMIMDEIETMEGGAVTGISHDFNDAQLTVYKIKDEFGQAANILSALSDAQINKDMIIQPVSNGSGTTPMTLSVPKQDAERAQNALKALGYGHVEVDTDIVKISAVGSGMKTDHTVSTTFFKTLADNKINTRAIATSEIKISVIVRADHAETALTKLHSAFGLDRK